MIDRRDLWSNGTVAHSSLKGQVAADVFTDGTDHRVVQAPATALRAAPSGDRDRELLWGQVFCVLDVTNGCAFGFSRADGYSGYVDAHSLLQTPIATTHKVRVRQTMALTAPDFKATTRKELPLSIGSELTVTTTSERWSTIAGPLGDLYVPTMHLTPINQHEQDPVTVAERLLGTPYLWGGNSAFGIDCSGLVQIACHACGLTCPGDSDQQARTLGTSLPPDTPPQRGDVLFWKGHVAWVADQNTLLHANAHHMAVTHEPLRAAVDRIMLQGGGPVTRHARLTSAE